ncbi:MEG-9 [Schistosoma mansoni]|uniref:MEG-9 n=1 Tax=Schistosoma mansoni TaxID=6183 RepID=UPI00022DC5E6|nr:MEG-9 [Schistosoma mansoni]|eukprot:XP_018648753.1 MEG-9 [Schistosoma mansoni]
MIRTILLMIISCQFITGFVVHESSTEGQNHEELAAAAGAHFLQFLNGCFLNMDNLKKLVFPG